MMDDMMMEMDVVMAWGHYMERCGWDDILDGMDDDIVACTADIHEFAENEIAACDDMGTDPHDDGITDAMIEWARTPYTDR